MGANLLREVQLALRGMWRNDTSVIYPIRGERTTGEHLGGKVENQRTAEYGNSRRKKNGTQDQQIRQEQTNTNKYTTINIKK